MPPADAGPTQKAGSILSAGLKQKPQAVGCLLEPKRQLAADPRLHPSPLLQTRSWLFKARAWRSAAGLAPGRGCGRPDVLKRKFRPAHIATQSGSSTGSQVSAPAAPQRVWQAEFAMPRGRPCALRRRDDEAPAHGGAREACDGDPERAAEHNPVSRPAPLLPDATGTCPLTGFSAVAVSAVNAPAGSGPG